MEKVVATVQYADFPNQYVSDKEKETMAYGLQIANSIQWQWFGRSGVNCPFYDRMAQIHRLRMYARGEQSIQKYKDELAYDGDLSKLNLDFTPVPIMPKFIDIVVNGMSDRLFKPNAIAIDAMSQSKRSKYQDLIEGQMLAKDVLTNIKEQTGVNTFVTDPDKLPETDEELALYMQLNFKPAIEIAEEAAIDTVLEQNKWYDLRKRVDYDQAVIGVGIYKHEFLQGAGIKVSWVDYANVIHSYTEDPNFQDVFYWGEVKTVPITELYKIDQSLTKDDIEEISKYSQSWYGQYNVQQYYSTSVFGKDICTLLYFNYKTTKKIVNKKKNLDNGGARIIPKEDTWNPPAEMMEEGNFEKLEKTIDVWYEGIMVAGTDIMLQWKLSENMVRPEAATQKALPNYIACAPRMYKGQIDSLAKRMIPFIDLIQMTHLKIQQVQNRVVPDGIFIDADGLNEVDLGNGLAYNPQEALRLFFQTGSVVGRSYTQDGEYNQGKIPIQQITSSSGGQKLQALIGNYNHYMEMIRTVTGLNEARDGSTPDPNALVGVQKLAAASSNTATRHILDGSLSMFRALCEALTYRIADILKYADFREEFANQIGKYNISILEEIWNLPAAYFGIFIEVSPDVEEKAQLEANIQIALAQKTIDLTDAIDIREIKNLKLANQLLKLKQAKKLEREEKMAMQQQAMIAQQQMAQQQLAAQTASQKVQMESAAKLEQINAQGENDRQTLQVEAMLKKDLMAAEFEYNLQLQGVESSNLEGRDKMKEDAKDKRLGIQSTHQSQLINQRENKLPPKNFESTNDHMGDLSFEDIGIDDRQY